MATMAAGAFRKYLENSTMLAETTARFIEKLKLRIDGSQLHNGRQVGFRHLAEGVLDTQVLIIQNTEAHSRIGWHEPMLGIEAREKESLRVIPSDRAQGKTVLNLTP